MDDPKVAGVKLEGKEVLFYDEKTDLWHTLADNENFESAYEQILVLRDKLKRMAKHMPEGNSAIRTEESNLVERMAVSGSNMSITKTIDGNTAHFDISNIVPVSEKNEKQSEINLEKSSEEISDPWEYQSVGKRKSKRNNNKQLLKNNTSTNGDSRQKIETKQQKYERFIDTCKNMRDLVETNFIYKKKFGKSKILDDWHLWLRFGQSNIEMFKNKRRQKMNCIKLRRLKEEEKNEYFNKPDVKKTNEKVNIEKGIRFCDLIKDTIIEKDPKSAKAREMLSSIMEKEFGFPKNPTEKEIMKSGLYKQLDKNTITEVDSDDNGLFF